MATNNLTPEMLRQINAILSTSAGMVGGDENPEMLPPPAGAYLPDEGVYFTPVNNWSGGTPTLDRYRGNAWYPGMVKDNSELNGLPYTDFDPQGNFLETGTLSGVGTGGGMFGDIIRNPALGIGTILAMPFLAGAAGLGAGAGAGGGAGTVGGSGAFLGEAPWAATGGGALDFGGAAAGGVGAGGVGGAGGSGAFLGEGIASGVPAWDAAATGAGLTLSGAGSGLSLLDGASKWLGPAATALGALAGSQGQDTSQTSVKSMDPRMDKLFYEDLAPRVQGLLAKQMAPGAMQGFTDMQSVGRNLLNQPVAGNGFNRFFPGR